jgi:hypothetical protein
MESRMSSCWAGIRRGGKLGAIIGLVIVLVMFTVCLGIFLYDAELREKEFAEFNTFWGAVRTVTSACAGAGLIVVYSAITGAAVVGIARLLRSEQAEKDFPTH